LSKLPKGWIEVRLERVAEVNPRKSVDLLPDDLVTFVPMAAVDEVSGTIARSTLRPLKEVRKGFTQFVDNDVIFAKITPSMENGKSAVARQLANATGFGSTEFHVLRSTGAVVSEYLWRFVRQQEFRDSAQQVMSGAVGQQRVPADHLRSHPLPLPPLREQREIVAKVDRLTNQITRARNELTDIPALIAKYRSALLELAFSGKLTADFRRTNKVGRNGLPYNWSVRSLGEISEIQGGVQVGKRRNSDAELVEVPYLRVANVQRGWLNLDEVKTISVALEEKSRLLLQNGDILMNEGGDRDKLGRGWIWDGQLAECIHQNHVFRIRLSDDILPPEFVSHFANERGQQYFFDQGTQTTNLASISKRKVAALPVPVPPLDEAREIVRRLETAFAWLDRVNFHHASASRLLPKLEDVILVKAFRGELVPQDPSDEPAAMLLERINAERAEQVPTRLKRAPRPPKVEGDAMMSDRSLEQVLMEASDWLPAQTAFQRCGVGDGTPTEEIERLYTQLRELDTAGRLEAEAVTDHAGRKLYDRIRLRTA
jgi:type I restriction enzyme, S subunit